MAVWRTYLREFWVARTHTFRRVGQAWETKRVHLLKDDPIMDEVRVDENSAHAIQTQVCGHK